MYGRTIVLLIVILFSSNCFAYNYDQLNQDIEDSGYDWVIHIGVGAATSMATISLLPDDWEPWIKYATGIASSFVIGGVIESFDKNWDNQDFMEYGYGGAGGAVIMWSWEIDWFK
jgi:multisubunit Na+/H+ antiporter MnhB subunit